MAHYTHKVHHRLFLHPKPTSQQSIRSMLFKYSSSTFQYISWVGLGMRCHHTIQSATSIKPLGNISESQRVAPVIADSPSIGSSTADSIHQYSVNENNLSNVLAAYKSDSKISPSANFNMFADQRPHVLLSLT